MKRAAPKNPGAQYGVALDKFRKAERELARALTKWNSLRQALRRCERRLDLAMRIEDEAQAVRS